MRFAPTPYTDPNRAPVWGLVQHRRYEPLYQPRVKHKFNEIYFLNKIKSISREVGYHAAENWAISYLAWLYNINRRYDQSPPLNIEAIYRTRLKTRLPYV